MAPAVTAIVVDNASSDGTVDRVRAKRRRAVDRQSKEPRLAAALNQGVRESGDSEFILVLNPDAHLLTAVDRLVESTQRHGLAAGRLVDETGRTQVGFTIRRFPTPTTLVCELFGINRLWPSNPVNRRYRYLDRDLNQPGLVDQAQRKAFPHVSPGRLEEAGWL